MNDKKQRVTAALEAYLAIAKEFGILISLDSIEKQENGKYRATALDLKDRTTFGVKFNLGPSEGNIDG